ncbi:hypothetical protein, partial [Ruegeria denitrificans]|uniref:hypothetical protein n=1 Tax=Ruegeria denitrificans TaxID=1715692 RepID=UPI001A94E59B
KDREYHQKTLAMQEPPTDAIHRAITCCFAADQEPTFVLISDFGQPEIRPIQQIVLEISRQFSAAPLLQVWTSAAALNSRYMFSLISLLLNSSVSSVVV